MIKLKDNEKVALAGLLHDVGKLLNRSNNYSKFSNFESRQHPHLSSWFVDFLVKKEILAPDEELKELVQKHHEGQFFSKEINLDSIKETRSNNFMKKIGLIVARADNYSSSERANEESNNFGKRDFKSVPLDSIFTRINLTKENKKDEISRYTISSLNEQNIFPKAIEKNTQNDLDRVIKNFLKEIEEIKVQDFNSLFINILDLLKKYTWSLPSDTQKDVCDISLFDHLKTTSAIALASYNYHTETNGSIDDTTQISIKNDKIEDHFLLIGGDISGIQKYIYALENTTDTAKRLRARSFFIKLLSDVGAYKIVNILDLTPANIIISSVCNKYLITKEQEQCEHCKKDVDFGKYLPKMTKLGYYIDNFENISKDEKTIELFGVLCKIYTDDNIEGEPYIINYYTENIKRNMGYLKDVYGGYVPIEKSGKIKTFEDIANESKSKNLGIIKGDVDNLGLIFSVGMSGLEEEILNEETGKSEKKKGVISISRISTLSRMLDNFFSYWLPKTLENRKEEFGSNYVVYSGGDDFMIVSSWDNSVKVAKFINDNFREYVSRNDNITITMGISITKPSEPIYYSSGWATEAEEKGKSSGKNGMVLFDTYIPWEDMYKVLKVSEFFNKNYKTKENDKNLYNQGFIYRLLTYTEMAEMYKKEKNPKYLKYISDFTYDLARNIIPRIKEEYKKERNLDDKEINEKIKNDPRISELIKYFGIESIDKKEDLNFLINYMRVVLNYVVRLNRETKGE